VGDNALLIDQLASVPGDTTGYATTTTTKHLSPKQVGVG